MTIWFAGLIFIITFAVIASEKVHKTTAALGGAMLMLLLILPGPSNHNTGKLDEKLSKPYSLAREIVPPGMIENSNLSLDKEIEDIDTFSRYVNFDVVFTLAGMMILVNILSGTGFFQYVAIKAAKLAGGRPIKTLILFVVSTAVLSALLDNVTTILLVAPVTFIVVAELNVSPIPFLMAETIASNIGGAATLIGDPPNLIIGSAAGLGFMAFLKNMAPFVLVLLVIYCLALCLHYAGKMKVTVEKRASIMELDEKRAITDKSNLLRGGIVTIITLIGFLVHNFFSIQPCVVAMSGASLALIICKVDVDKTLARIEWATLFFFLGIFIVVEGAQYVGLMSKIGSLLEFTSGWNPLFVILIVMWICGISVAFVNNVSFTAVIVSVIMSFLNSAEFFRGNIEIQHLMWWAVALAVCLGGNFTIIGAAANLVTAGISEQNGQKISFGEFLKYGFPISIFSLILATVYISIRYSFLSH